MFKSTTNALRLACGLIFSGLIIFAIVMTMNDWDFNKLNTIKYEDYSYQTTDHISDIYIDVNQSNISIIPSPEPFIKVVSKEQEKVKYSTKIEASKLYFQVEDNRKWFDYMSIMNTEPLITINVPRDYQLNIFITNKTGNIKISDLSLKTIDISVSTGNLKLENINASNLTTNGKTGNISISNSLFSNDIYIKRTTGNVDFSKIDAKNINIISKTGRVKGDLLSNKIFNVKTVTGKVNIPTSQSGGSCNLETTTGNILIDYYKNN